jgi:hypothetical protein
MRSRAKLRETSFKTKWSPVAWYQSQGAVSKNATWLSYKKQSQVTSDWSQVTKFPSIPGSCRSHHTAGFFSAPRLPQQPAPSPPLSNTYYCGCLQKEGTTIIVFLMCKYLFRNLFLLSHITRCLHPDWTRQCHCCPPSAINKSC